MRLIIDIGNSRTKLAVFSFFYLIYLDIQKEISIDILKNLFQRFTSINMSIISCVGISRESLSPIIDFISKNSKLIEMNSNLSFGINIKYETPNSLGVDRIAGVIGAKSLFPNQNILVIDAGSCITYDFIDKNNIYLGGGISPGFLMKFRALNNFTANLPLITHVDNSPYLGKSTHESILSGVIHGTLFEIKGFIDYYKSQVSGLKIILSGGDGDFIYKNIKEEILLEENLVLYGLNIILESNAK